MRIVIKSATNAETVLCDGPGRGLDKLWGPINDSGGIDDAIMFDSQKRMRAAATRTVNRGNKAISMTVMVSRQCGSIPAAFAWQMQFHATCIRSGEIYFATQDPAGNSVTWKLTSAGLNLRTTPVGATRVVTYTIQGGEFVKV